MLNKFREQQIKTIATDLIAEYDLYTFPINLRAIAEKENIQLAPFLPQSDGISGFLMKQGDDFKIGYSQKLKNQGFENFTIAHELGHYFIEGHPEHLLSDTQTHFSKSGYLSNNQYEREADVFASELLMPGRMIEKHLGKVEPGLKAVKSISQLCMTSLTSSAIKYAFNTADPVFVMLSQGDQIVWMIASEAIKNYGYLGWLEKNAPLPAKCVTRDFNSNPDNILLLRENSALTNLSHWLEGAPDLEALEETVGLGAYNRTLSVISLETLPSSIEEHSYETGETDDWIERMQKGFFRPRK